MLNGTEWELGLKGVYRLGRDDDVDDSAVKLMSEIDDSVELGAFVGWNKTFDNNPRHRFSATLGITQDVSDGHDGYVVEASAVYWRPVARPFDLGVRGGFSYASDDYMSTYFGVSSADSAASGLSTFSAGLLVPLRQEDLPLSQPLFVYVGLLLAGDARLLPVFIIGRLQILRIPQPLKGLT